MVILNQERGTGKTCTLIKLSSQNNIPIATPFNTLYIKSKAKELNLHIPEPIAIKNLDDLNNVDKSIYWWYGYFNQKDFPLWCSTYNNVSRRKNWKPILNYIIPQ